MTTTNNYMTKLAQADNLVEVQTGKVKLPVSSVSQPFIKKEAVGKVEGYRHSILINFKAYDPRNKERIAEAFAYGEKEEADISGMTFTHEILVTDRNPNPVLPVKGDIIEANVAFAEKEGKLAVDKAGNQIMNITSYAVPLAKELKSGGLFKKAERAGIPQEESKTEKESETSAF